MQTWTLLRASGFKSHLHFAALCFDGHDWHPAEPTEQGASVGLLHQEHPPPESWEEPEMPLGSGVSGEWSKQGQKGAHKHLPLGRRGLGGGGRA